MLNLHRENGSTQKKNKRKFVTVCDTVNQEKGQLFKALLMKTNSSERRAKGYHS